jgi:hypothetical protein
MYYGIRQVGSGRQYSVTTASASGQHTFGVAWILVMSLAYYPISLSHPTVSKSTGTHLAIPIVIRQQLFPSFLIKSTLGIRVDQQTLYRLSLISSIVSFT